MEGFFVLLWFLAIPVLLIYGMCVKNKEYNTKIGIHRKKYSDDENNYRDKVRKYIQDHISALVWHSSKVKPKSATDQIPFQTLQTEEMYIESGENDIYYQCYMADNHPCIIFKIFGETILISTEDEHTYTLSDDRDTFDANYALSQDTKQQRGRTYLYDLLQHDIPTIALVYIEHFIRNCVEEKEKFYQDLESNYQTYKTVNEPVNDSTERFTAWEKDATSYFINKYKDEYNITQDPAPTPSNEEEEVLYQVDYIDENQTQNG